MWMKTTHAFPTKVDMNDVPIYFQVEYVAAKGQQVESEVKQFLPEFQAEALKDQTRSLTEQWEQFEEVSFSLAR